MDAEKIFDTLEKNKKTLVNLYNSLLKNSKYETLSSPYNFEKVKKIHKILKENRDLLLKNEYLIDTVNELKNIIIIIESGYFDTMVLRQLNNILTEIKNKYLNNKLK